GTPNSTIPTKKVTLIRKKVHQIRNTNNKKNTNSEAKLNDTNDEESTISDEKRYTE
ncbi:42003_t:CDS:1, partial [Gigaspora margarita]